MWIKRVSEPHILYRTYPSGLELNPFSYAAPFCIFVPDRHHINDDLTAMNVRALSDGELTYYYHGLYKALKSYRFTTIIGWLVVLVGGISIPLGWEFGQPHGLIDIALSVATILAGLTVVQQAVASLSVYMAIPMQRLVQVEPAEEQPEVLRTIIVLMKDVEVGGWQEAYAAIRKLEEMHSIHGLPPLQ